MASFILTFLYSTNIFILMDFLSVFLYNSHNLFLLIHLLPFFPSFLMTLLFNIRLIFYFDPHLFFLCNILFVHSALLFFLLPASFLLPAHVVNYLIYTHYLLCIFLIIWNNFLDIHLLIFFSCDLIYFLLIPCIYHLFHFLMFTLTFLMFPCISVLLFHMNLFLLLLCPLLSVYSSFHSHTNIHNISFLQTILLDKVFSQILIFICLILTFEILLLFLFPSQTTLSVLLIPCSLHLDLFCPRIPLHLTRKTRYPCPRILPMIYRRLGKNWSLFVTSVFQPLSSLSPMATTISGLSMLHTIHIYYSLLSYMLVTNYPIFYIWTSLVLYPSIFLHSFFITVNFTIFVVLFPVKFQLLQIYMFLVSFIQILNFPLQ